MISGFVVPLGTIICGFENTKMTCKHRRKTISFWSIIFWEMEIRNSLFETWDSVNFGSLKFLNSERPRVLFKKF